MVRRRCVRFHRFHREVGQTLFDLKSFTIHPRSVAIYTSIGGGVLAVCGTFANILAALMYNLISDLVGGIRFDVVDEGK